MEKKTKNKSTLQIKSKIIDQMIKHGKNYINKMLIFKKSLYLIVLDLAHSLKMNTDQTCNVLPKCQKTK